MKYFVILISMLCLAACEKEKITGTKISINYTAESKVDSVVITDDLFTQWHSYPDDGQINAVFTFDKPNLYVIAFFKGGKHYSQKLWLNNGTPKVDLHFINEELVIDTVQNAPLYYEYFTFLQDLNKFEDNNILRNAYLLKKFEEHKNSVFSNLVVMNYHSYNRNNPKLLKSILQKLEQQPDDIKFGAEGMYIALQKELKPLNNLTLSLYEFTNRKNVIEQIPLKENKLYLVDFWFVKCVPCARDHKLISKRLNDLKKHNIEVIGIATDNNFTAWDNYLSKHSYNWMNYRQNGNNTPTETLGIWEFPTYFMMDKNGNIVSKRYHAIEDVFKDYIN